MLWGEASTWNWAQTRFSKRCLVWSGMIDTERYGTCREDQRGSKSWLVTCTNSGTFFLHLASMVYSVYSTILYNPTVPQLILHVFIHYVFVSKGNLIRALRVAWQRMQNCGNYMCYHLLHVVHQPLSRGSMMFHRESCCLTTSPRNLLEQQVQMAMKSDSSREVYDDIMIAAHGILVVWQTTTGTARNVGAREVQSSSKLVIQCYSKYVHMRFSMIQHDSCKKKSLEFVGILPMPIESAQEWVPIEEFWRGSILHGSCKRGRRCCALHLEWHGEFLKMFGMVYDDLSIYIYKL